MKLLIGSKDNTIIVNKNNILNITKKEKEFFLKPLLKECKRCYEIFPRDKEYFYSYKNGNFQSYCKKCNKEHRTEFYRKNKK